MDYLTLCQRVRERGGLSGSGPASVLGQTGEMARVVGWVQQAWLDLQSTRVDWGPLWRPLERRVDTGQTVIETPPDWRAPVPVGFRFDGHPLTWTERAVLRANTAANGMPVAIAARPDRRVEISPGPAASGLLTGEYYAVPQRLINSNDEPWLPDHLQDAIVYQALMFYGVYEDAPEIYQDAQFKVQQYLQRMTNELVAEIRLAGALA